jgi:hypothetical protein
MIQHFKRSICILLLSLLVAGKLLAQDPQYFVYIQNEKPQPFYVKYKGKLLSSSDRGYIIIAELPAGTMALTIGFPKNEGPEQQFKLRVGKNDQGFLLKKTDEKNYALYNLQTFAVTMAGSDGGENGRLQPLDNATAIAAGDSSPAAQTETAAAETVTPAAPAEAAPAPDTAGSAMMAALRRDIDSAMAGKAEVGAASRPVKKTNKFAETLDKVVSDDRPEDIVLDEPAAAPAAGAAVTGAAVDAGAAVAAAPEPKKGRRKRNRDKQREALTDEEQALLKDVLAEERKAAELDTADVSAAPDVEKKAPLTETSPEQPVASTEQPAIDPAAAGNAASPAVLPATEDLTTKKPKKQKRKKSGDPEFIEFSEDSSRQAAIEPATETAPAPVAEPAADVAAAPAEADTTLSRKERKKKRKLAEMIDVNAENPNNIVTDSVSYDPPARRSEKKDEGLKMINSDCQNMLDDAAFRKLLRKVVAAKDDEGMVEVFRRNTRNYCLETGQIRRVAQLIGKDEYRYQLLDMAYPKVYDSERYAGLSDLLSDSYYQGRFKAMLHK